MPKRVIDADGMWKSTKLSKCSQKSIPEYAWLYGLADAHGNFELTTDLRAIHSAAYATLRPLFTLHDLREVIEDFKRHGLLFTWEERGKMYAHWTGSDKPGRLPSKTQRKYYTNVDVDTPDREDKWPELQQYLRDVESNPGQPTLFTKSSPLPSAADIQDEAEATAAHYAERASANGDETDTLKRAKWNVFWNLYPNKRNEPGSHRQFLKLSLLVMDDVIASIQAWEASEQWKNPKFIPVAVHFLEHEDWKTPPSKEAHGKPDSKERSKRNLRNLGLAHS
jgi:hypothetical protein